MKTVKFPQGCAMTLYIPMVVLTNTTKGSAVASKFSNLEASVSLHGKKTAIVPVISNSYMTLFLPASLVAGQYTIEYSFKYDGIPNRGSWAGKLELVKDNAQSNWQGIIEGGIVNLDEQIFIAGNMMTDAELEALKAQYTAAIAAANASKAAYDTAKAQADAAAYNAAHTLTEQGIKYAVAEAVGEGVTVEVDLSPVTSILEDEDHGLEAIKDALDDLDVDVDLTPVTDLLTDEQGNGLVSRIWTGVNGIFNKLTDFIKVAAKATDVSAVGSKVDGIDTKVGGITDAASSNTMFGKIYQIINGLGNYSDEPADESLFGQVGFDETGDNKSLHEKTDDLSSLVGNANNVTTASTIFGKLAKLLGLIGASTDVATANTLFGRVGKATAKVDGCFEELTDEEHGLTYIATGVGEDAGGNSLHDKVGMNSDTATAGTMFGKLASISQELGNLRLAVAALKNGMVIVAQTAISGLQLASGTTSVWADPIASLSFDLLAPTDGTEGHWRLRFTAAEGFAINAPTLEGDLPTWASGKYYELDIIANGTTYYAMAKEW